MPSKWSFLTARFPMLPEHDPSYRDALDEQTRACEGMALAELAKFCNEAEIALIAVETQRRELKLQITAAENVLAEKMLTAGLDSIVTEGYRWSPMFDPHPVVTDRAAVRAWAEKNGLEDNLSLPWMTLKSVVKQALDPEIGTQKLPPGLDVYVTRSFRKTKQNK